MNTEADPGFWLRLPFAAKSASEARRQFDQWLTTTGSVLVTDVERQYDAQLVLSELIGNSVRHAAPLPDGTVEVAWRPADSGLDISVRDGGTGAMPELREAAPLADNGRGLAIVSALAHSWWVDRTDDLTTTHAVIA